MKSVKLFLGIMLCLVVLAGQAQASIEFNFEGVTAASIATYGNEYGVKFVDWGVAEPEVGDVEAIRLTGRKEASSVSSVIFSETFSAPPMLNSFEYYVTGQSNVTWTANILGGATGTGSFTAGTYGLFEWAGAFLTSIVFEVGPNTTLYLDNMNITPTPLPGAAILLGSGLLGLIGLRRREII